MITLAFLAVFSGFSLNLLLQFALGTAGAAGDSPSKTAGQREIPFIQFGILFISILFLWVFFSRLPSFWKGFSEYFLFFPFSALVVMGLELLLEKTLPRIVKRTLPQFTGIKKVYPAFTAYDGLVPFALFLTLALAGSFAGAVVLAFFFALGNLAAMLALNEIRRRSALEWVPAYLRGTPLVLISMGLLALITAAAAGILFRILEGL